MIPPGDTLPEQSVTDTNILLHYVRADELSKRVEKAYQLFNSPDAPLISIVTIGEMLSLALQFGWGTAKRTELSRILASVVTIPLEHPGLVEAYAEMDDFSRRIGRPRGKNDLWIAATARVTEARLLTTDDDFSHLDPLYIHVERVEIAGTT